MSITVDCLYSFSLSEQHLVFARVVRCKAGSEIVQVEPTILLSMSLSEDTI